MKKVPGFNLRSFTSFSLVISTIIMSWSGFILYVAPPGRIANWGTWKLMLFTKTEWQALHTIFSYLFFISPVGSIRTVVRRMPSNSLPINFFFPQAPYACINSFVSSLLPLNLSLIALRGKLSIFQDR
jgi:hypothetical protein